MAWLMVRLTMRLRNREFRLVKKQMEEKAHGFRKEDIGVSRAKEWENKSNQKFENELKKSKWEKLLCDSGACAEALTPSPSPAPLGWSDLDPVPVAAASPDPAPWDGVRGLEDQQRRHLSRIHARGVLWKNPSEGPAAVAVGFRLEHGGEVEADGNCLFTAARSAMGGKVGARELRQRTVGRFLEDYRRDDGVGRRVVDAAIRHLYLPDLRVGWGIHVVQEVKLLAKKADRRGLDAAIQELVDLGLQREVAAESIYKERCMVVDDGESWGKYMSISGVPEDEYDIITLQYTEEGLLTVDENRDGRAAAFGDDIAIESLATEFKREVYVVQAHGSDAMVDEENCVFFLPHRPRGQICEAPIFLFMKGTGWCGAGGDHYEPLMATPIPLISQEKAAVVL
ncbi:LOW QUALITY PROTEIN: uncharacterized protein LOC120270273 [Dioscorea cayenensis subsp. rotundata]|uniref:LOW QUALITY PROTEIN: uncharacterized protein LOC120270273 n=1 Tax=Dioscorea cayennensis subsp. rotundata TaxID=55577 RepID=A0AB40C0G1_DIOCR|nr:LOW QUALITY PROTEIN: uncharacterized protein LOC120270273 [Dioscorea cayenensis subsp. rotundata]